jgi:predicted neuraminidase
MRTHIELISWTEDLEAESSAIRSTPRERRIRGLEGGDTRMSTQPHNTLISAILLPIFFFCIASAPCASEKSIDSPADGVVRASRLEGAKEAYLPIVGKNSHAANLLSLQNGDLLCFWFTGNDEGSSGVYIAMSRLENGASKWSYPVVLSEHSGWSDQNPVPFAAPDGNLWLFHTSQRAGKGQTTAIVYALTSSDLGHTWTVPAILFSRPGTFIRQDLVVFHQGWLFPTYHSASFGITSNAQNDVSVVKISDDNGKTWTGCEVRGSGGLVQMNIVKLSGDQLIAFFRSRYADWIYKSWSTDGCHWTPPVATQLPNNNASIQAVRLKDGHLVMAFNNTHSAGRRGKPRTAARNILSVALSVDEGRTWPWVRDVQNQHETTDARPGEELEFSYPSVTQSPEGKVQLAFTFNRKTIKYMTFDEKWIRRGTSRGLFTGDSKP